MAYSNWGGKVWCDGEARHQNCDVTPSMVLEGTVYKHYLLHYMREEKGGTNEMFHAIVGDKDAGVLICLRKDYLSAVFLLSGEQLKPFEYRPNEDWSWWDEESIEFITPNGITVKAWREDWPSSVHCQFMDRNNRRWSAISGYGIGEGYQDWD